MTESAMIYVYEIPRQRSKGTVFNAAKPIVFYNVDWFNEPGKQGLPEMSDEAVLEFVRNKPYRHPNNAYLILFDDRALVIPAEKEDTPSIGSVPHLRRHS